MNSQSSLTLRLRTKDNLMELLLAGKSGAWKIGKNKEQEISKVEIFNWDGSLKLEATFDLSNSCRTEDNRLVVGLSPEDSRIVRCDPPFEWVGQNPVKYFDKNSQDEEEELSSEEVAQNTETKFEEKKHSKSPEESKSISVALDESKEKTQFKELDEIITSFPIIIKNFLSTEYSDCIQDNVDGNQVYLSEEKILQNWEAIKANGQEREIIQLAMEWAKLIQNTFPATVAYSEQYKRNDLFEEINLLVLTAINLIAQGGGGFLIKPTGKPIARDDDDLVLISNYTYEIIRILSIEIIWQSAIENIVFKVGNQIVFQMPEPLQKLINYKKLFTFSEVEFEIYQNRTKELMSGLTLTKESYTREEVFMVLDYFFDKEVFEA